MTRIWRNKNQKMVARRTYCDSCGQVIGGMGYSVGALGESKHTCSKACLMKLLCRIFDKPMEQGDEVWVEPMDCTPYGIIPDDAGWD